MSRTTINPPTAYTLFFLYIEPFSALVGALYAIYYPSTYLYLTHRGPYISSLFSVPVATKAVLKQLGNLYVFFALNEALVLRSAWRETSRTKKIDDETEVRTVGGGYDLRVWRTLLFGLLVADVGHLWSVKDTGSWGEVYLGWKGWNAMGWGNVGFVYLGMFMRICFLSGIGLG